MCRAKVCKIFILSILMLGLFCASAQAYAPVELDRAERYAMNLFLSNFTEVGVDSAGTNSDDRTLVDFAHDHMWFNSNDDFEYGEYFGGNNCRISDDRIQSIIDAYFYHPPVVNPGQTRFDYDGEYYYHYETGGWGNSGFAHAVSVCPLGDDEYFVSFYVFGGGEFWDNDVLDDSLQDHIDAFGGPGDCGSAILRAGNLSDRSSYKLISYTRF